MIGQPLNFCHFDATVTYYSLASFSNHTSWKTHLSVYLSIFGFIHTNTHTQSQHPHPLVWSFLPPLRILLLWSGTYRSSCLPSFFLSCVMRRPSFSFLYPFSFRDDLSSQIFVTRIPYTLKSWQQNQVSIVWKRKEEVGNFRWFLLLHFS